jgi:hypothetical protein
MTSDGIRSGYTCPACGRQFNRLRDTLACWLEAEPNALRTRSLREIGAMLSCSGEAVRQAANRLGVATSLGAKDESFRQRSRPRQPRHRTDADRERARRAWQALKADPQRYAADLERRRQRRRERWRSDPEFRQRRLDAMKRWQMKRRQDEQERPSA